MSEVKAKKTDSSAKRHPPKSTEKTHTAKKKRKEWMKERFRKKKPSPQDKPKPKAQHMLPPQDVQHFSSNWKTLQEMLKVSQPEKKQPVQAKPQNGTPRKEEPNKSASKNISKDNVGPRQMDAGQKKRPKTLPGIPVSKDAEVNSKVCVSETGESAAPPKRKKDGGKKDGGQAAKKKKPVTEERKPTEDDLWFDDVDPDDIEATVGAEAAEIMRKKQGIPKTKDTDGTLVKEHAFEGLTKAVAIDCEMVGVGLGGEDSILARVSLVNQFGKCIYDKHVKPTEKVTDYRTAVSGIRPGDIKDGVNIQIVQREVAEILKGRIVVGHAIHNDLKILLLDHPKKKIRDTQKYMPFKKTVKCGRPSLKLLCREILNVKVQQGEHSSVQDAQATMRLYTLVKKQWEAEIKASQKSKDSDKKNKRKPSSPKAKGEKLMG